MYFPMKQYPIDCPPTCPGIYMLINEKTGQVYVGKSVDLRRRYGEWRQAFLSRLGITNKQIMEAAEQSSPADWSFSVLMELPGSTEDDLARYEASAINKVTERRPTTTLNVVLPTGHISQTHAASRAATTITDENGQRITYAAAANRIGCAHETLSKRLAAQRKKGITNVTLVDLISRSRRFGLKP